MTEQEGNDFHDLLEKNYHSIMIYEKELEKFPESELKMKAEYLAEVYRDALWDLIYKSGCE